jgi:flagellar protein FliO/FliZ
LASTPTPEYLSSSLNSLQGQPTSFDTPSLLPTLLNLVLSLAFVLLLVYLAYWLLRRWRLSQGLSATAEATGLIHVLEKSYVDNRHGMAVIEMGGNIYFVGLGETLTLLDKVSDPDTVEKIKQAAPSPGGLLGFREQFDRVGTALRRQQWAKSKQDLRAQADDLENQINRLKSGKKKDQA